MLVTDNSPQTAEGTDTPTTTPVGPSLPRKVVSLL